MYNTYMSFLGIGSVKPGNKNPAYTPAVYTWNDKKSKETPFVQSAELELMKPAMFDDIKIVTTEKAYNFHFNTLSDYLEEIGYNQIDPIILKEDMSGEGQWEWFELILESIKDNTKLTVDLTHGYRSIPIIFSTALNFLQKAKNIVLEHVLYGAFDPGRDTAPIIDMKDFYNINLWADSVERIVEEADTRKMAELTSKVPDYQISQLNDQKFIALLEDLTNRIKNVDINNIHFVSRKVIDSIIRKMESTNKAEKILFELILKKYSELAGISQLNGMYTRDYFIIQLNLIALFNEHKLFMQSFTAMREFIGSLGLIGIKDAKYSNDKGRKLRRKYAEIFINMLRWKEKEWGYFDESHSFYKPENEKHAKELLPFYEQLKSIQLIDFLRTFVADLTKYRNRLDHAWSECSGFENEVIEKAPVFHADLSQVIKKLIEHKMLE
ncbi:MAG: TIGR02221 family CRISPR-associated protein [bacterium]